MNLKNIIYSMHPLERKVIPFLLNNNFLEEIIKNSKLNEAEINTGLQLLEQKKFINLEKNENIYIILDRFGEKYINSNLPEICFLKEILNEEKKKSKLKLEFEEINSALGILKRNNLINIRKEDDLIFTINEKGIDWLKNNQKNPLNLFKKQILKSELNETQRKVFENFIKRKGFLKEIKKKEYKIKLTELGKKIVIEIKNKYSDLDLIETLDVNSLKNESWKGKEFRFYDINLKTSIQDLGRTHPMIEVNNILSNIFLEMGFIEMKGPMIESAFWNMDVMWIPQDHPARDEQDTFYLKDKIKVPKDYFELIKKIHEKGIKRTHTEKNEFKIKISEKQLLRTHSTSTSFRYLSELGKKQKKGENINGKYFYLATNFRNEAVDATHLSEFFQGEGFIIGDNLSLADLMGFIKKYLNKLGIYKIKFKPTFNPYTEPSMEAHYYDEKIQKWYSIINSGIFRPETLKTFGLENKTVIAWGFGATRIAKILTNKDSLREITGSTCDFNFLKERPIIKTNIFKN